MVKRFFICFSVLLFAQLTLVSQTSLTQDEAIIPPQSNPVKGYRVYAEIFNGDTIASIVGDDVWIYADYTYKNRRQYEAWTRTKYNVKKVYPYAILAAARLKEYNRELEKLTTENERAVYLKAIEKALRKEFEAPLKDLTESQGQILLKLIDRETGHTSYELVKTLRGNFQAFMWQSLARLFGSNMKRKYDAQGEDQMIERAITLIENGQF